MVTWYCVNKGYRKAHKLPIINEGVLTYLHVLPTHDYEIVHPAQAHESWIVVGLFSLEIHKRSFLHCQEHQQQQQQQLLQKFWG